MRSIRQLLRQPIKTIAGILLITIAVAVLCISFAQTLAARDTSKRLLDTYMTVALPSNKLLPENIPWIDSFITEHPELVKSSIKQGLASAYIPALTPDNYTQHRISNRDNTDHTNEALQPSALSYDVAMLEIELIEYSGYVIDYQYEADNNGNLVSVEGAGSYRATLNGKVIRAIGLQDGYHDPAEYTINISLLMPSQEAFEALKLQPGRRYLVCGNDYYDLDWELRDYLAGIMIWRHEESLPEWDMSTFTEIEGYHGTTKYKCKIGDLYHGLSFAELSMFRTVKMFIDCITAADKRYESPTIVCLEGSAEEFLASDAGKLWNEALKEIEINCHCFPIIATNDLSSVAAFALGRSSIIDGRSFTDEEINSGSNMCLISQSLAMSHDLKIGDSIDLSYLIYDLDNPHQQYIHDGLGIVNPAPYAYFKNTTSLGNNEQYVIVGIYKQNAPWGSVENDLYAFTPNTIYVPQKSVTGTMDFSNAGQFLTLILHSDKLLETQLHVIDAELDEVFEYYDNGYNNIASGLTEYEAAANRILPIGIVVYAVVMLLFLFLFPAQEKSALARMDSMGAGHGKRVKHIVFNVLGILVPGCILGTIVAMCMWESVAIALRDWMRSDITIQLDKNSLWLVTALQAALITSAATILGAIMSTRVSPMQRR